jgi:hydroxymethylpyrimidine/phosphomethylpyrimidine kinase
MSNQGIHLINQIKEIYDYFSSIEVFSKLIPEVRTNISGALPNANYKSDIAAVEGRITIIGGFPKACGDIKFGVSDHTARLLITAQQMDSTIHFVINLKYDSNLIQKLQKSTPLNITEINREQQPKKIKEKEDSTMQWLIKKSFEEIGKIPDIIWDKGAIGKEPMIRLFAKDSDEMISKLSMILKFLE